MIFIHELGHLVYINDVVGMKPPVKIRFCKAGIEVGTPEELNKLTTKEYKIAAIYGIAAGLLFIAFCYFIIHEVTILYLLPYVAMIRRDMKAFMTGK